MANPVYEIRIRLRTDASQRGIGEELLQYVDGQRRTVAFLAESYSQENKLFYNKNRVSGNSLGDQEYSYLSVWEIV